MFGFFRIIYIFKYRATFIVADIGTAQLFLIRAEECIVGNRHAK